MPNLSTIWSSTRRLAVKLWALLPGRRRLAVDAVPSGDPGALSTAMFKDMLHDKRSERRLGLAKALLYATMVLFPLLFWAGPAGRASLVNWIWDDDEVVAVIRLQGEMSDGSRASAARLVPALRKAFASPNVEAVVLEIDSPGGSPLEAERIYSALDAERKANPKPVVAVINNVGASAAYMVAMHCDQIYAGRYSLVGSIGAVISTWDFHRALQRMDVSQKVYASGELKAMLNPYVPGTEAADRKAQDLVRGIADQFVADMVEKRGKKLAKGVNFASGEVWGGRQAHQLGLVDEVGTLEDVLRARWPNAKVRGYGGAQSAGAPFGEALSDWLRAVVTDTLEPRIAVR